MKKVTYLFSLVLIFTMCSFSSFTSPKALANCKVVTPPVVITVIKNFTTSNGLPGVVTLKYPLGGIYSSITVTIQGEGNVPLSTVSHSSGPPYFDVLEGYKAGSYYEYFVDVAISGGPTMGWQINSASGEAVVI